MVELSADVSDPLLALLKEGAAPVDAVEVGPWFSVEKVRAYRQAVPGMSFHMHAADLIMRVGVLPGAARKIAAYQAAAASPWVSAHITLWPPEMKWLMLKNGWRIPPPDPDRATRRFIGKVRRLQRALGVPVWLENNSPLPFPGCEFEIQPGRIAAILADTGCGFLLDLGHARCAAEVLGLEVYDYLQQLPLERVCQVHASGPRVRDGRLSDVHEPLQDFDYRLVEWVLAHSNPQVVTLEYIRDRDVLREQLQTLRKIIDRRIG